MRELLIELSPILQILQIPHTQINTHCTVFEDNIGEQELAKTEKYRAQTKHIAINITTTETMSEVK